METTLPYRAEPQAPQRYLDDLHSSPQPSSPFDASRLTSEHLELLKRRQLRLAGIARTDLPTFFEFTFREETSRRRLVCAAHQRLVFEFISHYRCSVVRMPRGFSKTYCMSARGLQLLGRETTRRGMFVSSSEDQAQKPLLAARLLIESSPDIRLVFPHLVPSKREGEPWTQSAITVDRPYGIRDASMTAVGLDSKRVPGSRLDWLNIDDILDEQNTLTADGRTKVQSWVRGTALPCVGQGGWVSCTNTPWHPEDLTYLLEGPDIGWPSLTMDCWGGVQLKNADDFDSEELRPSRDAAQEEAETGIPAESCRLMAHDKPAYSFAAVPLNSNRSAMETRVSIEITSEPEPWEGDAEELVPLWPEVWPTPALLDRRATMGGGLPWARGYEMKVSSDEDARVKQEWIEAARTRARALGFVGIQSKWVDGNAFTGVDLAFSKKKKSDDCAVFTFAVLPDNSRLPLDVEVGKFTGKELLRVIQRHHDNFGSQVAVESNAAQRLLRQWALDADMAMRIVDFNTGKNKHDASFGVESIFLEFENGVWLVPTDKRGKSPPGVQRWLSNLTDYRRGKHTGDVLMASWIARERARALGALGKGAAFWSRLQTGGLGGITSR